MPNRFWSSLASGSNVWSAQFTLGRKIGVAFLLGVAVAGVYRWARRGESVKSTFLTTLILLATLIAMATQIIGDNVARAFSLVGALSVVRFRTVVKDTQDTAFVIFAVVVGMASGADHLAVGLIGLALIGVASPALWPPAADSRRREIESTLAIRIGPAQSVRNAVEIAISAVADRFDLVSATTAKQGLFIDLSYRIVLRRDAVPFDLVVELKRLDGVESVDLQCEE
jgi:hypothetical protein